MDKKEKVNHRLRRLKSNAIIVFGTFLIPQALLLIFLQLSSLELVKNVITKFPFLWYFSISGLLLIIILKLASFVGKVFKAKRWDILTSFFVGLGLFVYLQKNTLFDFFDNLKLNSIVSFAVWATLLLIAFILKISDIQHKENDSQSNFLSDNVDFNAVGTDWLNVEEKAKNFAKHVIDNFSSNSLVFGIDAPWGSGKTTYLGFARNYWEKEKDRVIVFNFQTQSLDPATDIFKKFVEELYATLKKNNYIPEIKNSIFRYFKLLKEIKFSFNVLDFSLNSPESYEEAFDELKENLRFFKKKIIIIIDDLDRLTLDEVKVILNIVKKSFVLPNVSYVLCYDTENINAFEERLVSKKAKIKLTTKNNEGNGSDIYGNIDTTPLVDNRKIAEFFEKIVNVKISLFPSPNQLMHYFSEGLKQIGLENTTIKPLILAAFTEIFDPNCYYLYRPFIGDLRKIKRFINTLILLNRNKVLEEDYTIQDYNIKDLVNLILIYINYPNTFRIIYDTETNGGKYFFSAIGPYDDISIGGDKKLFYNSEKYFDYINTLNSELKYLIEQIFTLSIRLPNSAYGAVDHQLKSTLACFNGASGTGRNLEAHLQLIVNGELLPPSKTYNFYLAVVEKIKLNTSMEVVVNDETAFNLENGEESFSLLFDAISNTNLATKDVQKVINYIVSNTNNFSLLEVKNKNLLGLRDNLMYNLIAELDRGWSDERGGRYNNSSLNLLNIAYQVFGEEQFEGKGILETLSYPSRGVLGIHDLMVFRLFCSHDRSGGTYNLFSALGAHENPDAPKDGLITALAVQQMREISQKCFQIFKKRYIDPQKNFIQEAQEVSLQELLGKYQILFETIDENEEIRILGERAKNKVISFIAYQLTNASISMGVGCGLYNASGKGTDQEIREIMNDYLFNICFNKDSEEGKKAFIDFMLIQLSHTKSDEDERPIFNFKTEIKNMLDLTRLAIYWRDNKEEIVKVREKENNRYIYTYNFDLSYSKDFDRLYAKLEEITKEQLGLKD